MVKILLSIAFVAKKALLCKGTFDEWKKNRKYTFNHHNFWETESARDACKAQVLVLNGRCKGPASLSCPPNADKSTMI